MLEQILINILQNAEHALAETQHGRVSLSARLNKRSHVSIEISDNGPGVAHDIERKIFIPFFTTKREGSGVGYALLSGHTISGVSPRLMVVLRVE